MKPVDASRTGTRLEEAAPVGRSPWRNGSSTWPYPELDLLSLEVSGFPRFPVRSRRNH
jgi:hypothetical protein